MSDFYPLPPRNTAVHEAGHSVAARALGARRVKASIVPGPVGESPLADGYAAHDMPATASDLEALRADLVISVAGHAAEMIDAGRSLDDGPAEPREIAQRILGREGLPRPNAREYALRELTKIYGDRLTAYQALDAMSADILRRAVVILKREWPEVERLAERLRAERTVTL